MFCETVDKSKLLELLAPSQQLFSVFTNLHATNLFVFCKSAGIAQKTTKVINDLSDKRNFR